MGSGSGGKPCEAGEGSLRNIDKYGRENGEVWASPCVHIGKQAWERAHPANKKHS